MLKKVPLKVSGAKPVATGMPRMGLSRSDMSRPSYNTKPAGNGINITADENANSVNVAPHRNPPRPAPHLLIGWEKKF